MYYVLFFYVEHLKNSDILIVRIKKKKKKVSQHEQFTALDGNTAKVLKWHKLNIYLPPLLHNIMIAESLVS